MNSKKDPISTFINENMEILRITQILTGGLSILCFLGLFAISSESGPMKFILGAIFAVLFLIYICIQVLMWIETGNEQDQIDTLNAKLRELESKIEVNSQSSKNQEANE